MIRNDDVYMYTQSMIPLSNTYIYVARIWAVSVFSVGPYEIGRLSEKWGCNL